MNGAPKFVSGPTRHPNLERGHPPSRCSGCPLNRPRSNEVRVRLAGMTGKGFYSLVTRASFVAGVGFCLIGVGSAIYFPHFRKHALQTNGVINNLIRDENNGNVYLCPEFSFETPDGRHYKVDSHNCSNLSEFSMGEAVSVLYRPSDPTDAYIDSPGQFSGFARWEFKTGAFALLIAILLFWYARRRGIPIKWLDGWSS
jgi:hypothetical protein